MRMNKNINLMIFSLRYEKLRVIFPLRYFHYEKNQHDECRQYIVYSRRRLYIPLYFHPYH